ncbi:glutamate-gated chloride channel-like isoform X2, partial [Aphis craccivora]
FRSYGEFNYVENKVRLLPIYYDITYPVTYLRWCCIASRGIFSICAERSDGAEERSDECRNTRSHIYNFLHDELAASEVGPELKIDILVGSGILPGSTLFGFENGKSDKHILDHLLNTDIYDKRLLPPSYGPSIVNVSVVLFTLSSPDESSLCVLAPQGLIYITAPSALSSYIICEKYDIEFLLQQEWYDSRLQFPNQTAFSVLNGIHHQGDIWLPDTNFHMHGDFKPTQRPIRFTLNVYGDGRVEYTTR